jgi:DNA-binding GntR family transcriptional regulator
MACIEGLSFRGADMRYLIYFIRYRPEANVNMRLRHIERTNLSAKVYASLRDALMVGDLKPGIRLSGRLMAEEFGVSQTPVREALLQLVAERALIFQPNHSVTVPPLTADQYAELRDIRVALEGQAARLAASHPDRAQIDALEQVHQRMMVAKRRRDVRTTLRLNLEFHFGLYRISGREELVAMIESLWMRTGPYLNLLYLDRTRDRSLHEHEKVVAALRAGDGRGAEAAIARDINVNGEIILGVLGRRSA